MSSWSAVVSLEEPHPKNSQLFPFRAFTSVLERCDHQVKGIMGCYASGRLLDYGSYETNLPHEGAGAPYSMLQCIDTRRFSSFGTPCFYALSEHPHHPAVAATCRGVFTNRKIRAECQRLFRKGLDKLLGEVAHRYGCGDVGRTLHSEIWEPLRPWENES